MKRPPSSPDSERHPALDTFERVLNNGVIVDRASNHRLAALDAIGEFDAIGVESTHPLFVGETWWKPRSPE
jgi:hypothetical protein